MSNSGNSSNNRRPGRGRGRGRGGRGRSNQSGRGRGSAKKGSATGGSGSSAGGRSSSSRAGSAGRGRNSTTSGGRRKAPPPPLPPSTENKLVNGMKGADAHTVGESDRIRFTRILMDLRENDDKERLEFPATLTNTERKFVHQLAAQFGLKSKSTGKGENRRIAVTKLNATKKTSGDDGSEKLPILRIGRKGETALLQHLQRFPPTHTEELESHETGAALVEALTNNTNSDDDDNDAVVAARLIQLGLGVPKEAAPTIRRKTKIDLQRRRQLHAAAQRAKQSHPQYQHMLQKVRAKLPAYEHQEHIVQTVADNPVTIISGETGCGKSTQVPQFLLDAFPESSIVVTQPRRISAIAVAERVAQEQCQNVGQQQVGYQVRLDSAQCDQTQLLFVTPGVLLRQMQTSPSLQQYTMIVIDEIHERDKYQEFLLIVLRDLLPLRPDLRLVLMSATLQTMSLVEYFESTTPPAIVEMEGRMFPVQEFFLEHVLEMTGYIDATTAYDDGVRLEAELAKLLRQQQQTNNNSEGNNNQQEVDSLQCVLCGKTGFTDAIDLGVHVALCDGEASSDENNNHKSSDGISDSLVPSDDVAGDVAVDLSQFEDYDVDGNLEFEDYDINGTASDNELDARLAEAKDVNATGDTNCTQQQSGQESTTVATAGDAVRADTTSSNQEDSEVIKWDGESPFDININPESEPTEKEEELLNQYQTMHDDEQIDNYLLLEVVQYIVKSSYGSGGILVFLPGWQEISEFSLLLENTNPFHDRSQYLILPLHSGIPSKDQRRVLRRPPRGVRKIVLSTNLAETSLTIDDIAFVVDTGRAKEKSYDPHMKTSTLQSTWISQASAKQRKGRAGRTKPGVCFHLFSSRRHSSMRPFTESELLRTPLEELCLMCKQLELTPGGPEDDDGVPAFLAKAMSAPHLKSVANALELLVDLGAMLPETNDLTTLGKCLSTMSLHPRVGKMVIWSYLLGCAGVASNMAVGMSYKSPFTLPPESMRRAADNAKVQLSRNSESDQVTIHYALEKKKQLNQSSFNGFCRSNFLSTSTMQMISDLRKNLTRELTALGLADPVSKNQYHNRHNSDVALWQAAIAAGLYPNVAYRRRDEVNFSTMSNRKVKVHVSSVNAVRGQPLSAKCQMEQGALEFLCFGEIVKGARIFTANQTTHLASPLPLLLLCGTALTVRPDPTDEESKTAILNLDDWIVFRCNADTAAHVVVLRKRLESAFWRTIANPSAGLTSLSDTERDAVEILGTVLRSAYRSAPTR